MKNNQAVELDTGTKKPLPKTEIYYKNGLKVNGEGLMGMETTHIMILYFFIGGIDILGKKHLLQKQKLVAYILSLESKHGGFSPSSLYSQYPNLSKYDLPHIVFTYSALNCLHILGALDQVDKVAILKSISKCQREDGSFSSFENTFEADLRFVYSALSVCKLLGDFSFIDTNKVKQYIQSCFNYDGGFGLRPFCESHSGAIYCAVASYFHMGCEFSEKQKRRVINFLVQRQTTNKQNDKIVGIQGRVGKLPDSCYSFWVGASLKLLTGENLLNPFVENFIWLCFKEKSQNFGKYPTSKGDPVHTFHSITSLKILREDLQNISLSQLIRIN